MPGLSYSDFSENRTSLEQPKRTGVRPEPRSGSRSGTSGERRTHRPGVQLLGAPGRSRRGPLMEPQDGNQQQPHLLETSPRRRMTDRRSIGTDQDGPALLQHRLPPPVLLSDKPEGSLARSGARTHAAGDSGSGTGTHDSPQKCGSEPRAAPCAFPSRQLGQIKAWRDGGGTSSLRVA